MASHVKVLGILHIVLGSLGMLAAVLVLVFLGGLGWFVGMTAEPHDARVAAPILGGIAGAAFIIIALLSLPSIIAGFGLLQFRSWARILTLILSGLDLFHVPFGTALGIYGFWVLLSSDSEHLFNARSYPVRA